MEYKFDSHQSSTGIGKGSPMVAQSRWLLSIAVALITASSTRVFAAPIGEPPSTNAKPTPIEAQSPTLAELLPTGDAAAARLTLPSVQQGVRALQAGDLAGCLSDFEAAHREDPIVPPPLIMLAQVYLVHRQPREAIEALEQAAVQSPEHPELYLLCAQLALAQGRNLDAWVHFDRALNLDSRPKWPAAYDKDFEATCYFGMATIAERRQDWQVAEAAYREWDSLDPGNAHVLDSWGKSLFLMGKEEDALDRFTRAHSADSTLNAPEVSMAAMATSAGRFDDAQQWYEKAKKKHPRDASVLFEQGVSLLMSGKFAEARKTLDQATEVGAKLESFGEAVPLMKGYAAAGAEDYAAAEQLFTKVLEASPGQFDALRHLTLALVEQKDVEKNDRALELASVLANNHPQSAAAQVTLAWVQFRLGQGEAAEKTLAIANLATADADSLFHAAQLLVARGHGQAAREILPALNQAVAKPGIFVRRQDASAWLKSIALVLPRSAAP